MSTNQSSWQDLKLDERLVQSLLAAGYHTPTPIQTEAIPAALAGGDIIASARTGSGKTAGFCLPIIQKLIGRRGTYALILAPTREIALQTSRTLEQFGGPVGITCVTLIGGVPYQLDAQALAKGPHVIVGTPGRICDHLDRGNLWLEYIECLVLDEADRMLDMGFAKELNRIVSDLPKKRQTLLFSATIPGTIQNLAKAILHDPKRISIGSSSRVSQSIAHELLWLKEPSKKKFLMRLLRDDKGTVIVFCRTKDGAARLYRTIHAAGIHESTYISSNRRQSDREDALRGFQTGQFRVLVATDVAGRGIHVDDVSHVINYDFPREPEDYIHRIGRTGRKDASGLATSFVTPHDMAGVTRTERLLKMTIPTSNLSEMDRPGSRGERRPTESRSHRERPHQRPPRRGEPKEANREREREPRREHPRREPEREARGAHRERRGRDERSARERHPEQRREAPRRSDRPSERSSTRGPRREPNREPRRGPDRGPSRERPKEIPRRPDPAAQLPSHLEEVEEDFGTPGSSQPFQIRDRRRERAENEAREKRTAHPQPTEHPRTRWGRPNTPADDRSDRRPSARRDSQGESHKSSSRRPRRGSKRPGGGRGRRSER